MLNSNSLPLLYDFTKALRLGDGQHEALVQVSGKALVEVDPDEGETSIIAVDPGGFWGLGTTFEEAWSEFYDNLKTILFDLAAEAEEPMTFRQEVDRLLVAAHQGLQDDWQAAAEARKSGEIKTSYGLPIREDYGKRGIQMVIRSSDPEKQATDEPQRPQIAA